MRGKKKDRAGGLRLRGSRVQMQSGGVNVALPKRAKEEWCELRRGEAKGRCSRVEVHVRGASGRVEDRRSRTEESCMEQTVEAVRSKPGRGYAHGEE